jgi:hypothetical protein
MGRIKTNDYITMQVASDYIYELTKVRRKANTLMMWSLKGLLSKHGKRLRLHTTIRLNRKFTTKEWVDDFMRETG